MGGKKNKAALPTPVTWRETADVATAGKEWLIYMKGNPGGTHSFPLTKMPKSMQLNIIIAFYHCGVRVTLLC